MELYFAGIMFILVLIYIFGFNLNGYYRTIKAKYQYAKKKYRFKEHNRGRIWFIFFSLIYLIFLLTFFFI